MRRKLCVLSIALCTLGVSLFSGCAAAKIAVSGPASYSDCESALCPVELSFDPQLITTAEGALSAKTIYFEGKVIVFGDGFSNIWFGKIKKDKIVFKKVAIENPPANNVAFDWSMGTTLLISWQNAAGEQMTHQIIKKVK